MHELALIDELLRRVDRLARERGASRVLAVRVGVGRGAAVDPALLGLAFDAAVSVTPWRGAVLLLTPAPTEGCCSGCGVVFPVAGGPAACPACGDGDVEVLLGEELRIAGLTLEAAEDDGEPVAEDREALRVSA